MITQKKIAASFNKEMKKQNLIPQDLINEGWHSQVLGSLLQKGKSSNRDYKVSSLIKLMNRLNMLNF
jgi:hypothetical protein